MRVCENCGKANQDIRKYCIRCGKSLVKIQKKKEQPPKTPVPETGRVVTKKTLEKEAEEKAKTSDQAPVSTGDEWVKPSQVARNRVRSTSSPRMVSELDKAREAFRKAEAVGLEEHGSGVIETRMLRASEVKELMESQESWSDDLPPPAPTASTEERDISPPSDEIPEIEAHDQEPKTIAEGRILGSMSVYLDQDKRDDVDEASLTSSATTDDEFTSAKYLKTEEASQPSKQPESSSPEGDLEYEDLGEESKSVEHPPRDIPSTDKERINACTECGAVLSIDSFEYPPEIYSAMGHSRLKQARFLMVQGISDEAQRVVRIAASLFKQAGDDSGMKEAAKLVESMKRT